MKIKLNRKGNRQFSYRHVFILYTSKWKSGIFCLFFELFIVNLPLVKGTSLQVPLKTLRVVQSLF